MYIERKTRNGATLNDKGPAAIGWVSFSKTGKTIYYDGKAFQKPGSSEPRCTYGNYYCWIDDEIVDEFWITGVKKRGSNRMPWATGQPVVEYGSLD
jgi:hypothetical protein